ncbi:MAG: hypothetical protein LUF35_04540 [Lachnospiraceae bacterium]|nr:hypothetical protein [Lachnospiraceae bacterium]
MSVYTFSQWVLFFYIYCFLGWVFESVYVSIMERRLVNRGFLKGPLLPIYGSGALCVLIVTIPFRGSIPLMCLAGMAAATLLEYVTGAAMEKLFHVRYWDYTGKLLNVNGHICLMSTLCWGVMTILVVEVLQVFLEKLVFSVDEQLVTVAVFAITPFVTADLVTSFRAAIHLRDILIQWERLSEELEKLEKQKQELEAAIAGRRREMEAALAERREELEVAFADRKREMDASWGERKQEMEMALAERRGEIEASLAGRREELEASLAQRNQEMTDKVAALQERVGRMTVESDLLKKLHGKSIQALLKRNPRAVSIANKEAFTALKQSFAKKINVKKDADDGDDSEEG